jgi:hypothetical protein
MGILSTGKSFMLKLGFYDNMERIWYSQAG